MYSSHALHPVENSVGILLNIIVYCAHTGYEVGSAIHCAVLFPSGLKSSAYWQAYLFIANPNFKIAISSSVFLLDFSVIKYF